MGKFSPVAQAPRYLRSFQCIGAACIENCCTGWRVSIDKPTYQKYQSIKGEPLASLMRQHVQKNTGSISVGKSYASIALNGEQACPFLDEAKLCQIHAGLGAQALSNTCSQYPRIYTLEGEQIGVAASLSCPEAARLALASADAVEMEGLALPFANASLVPINRRLGPVAAGEPDLVRRHARLLREALTVVIKHPDLSAAQALVVSGLLLRQVAKVAADVATDVAAQSAKPDAAAALADQGLSDAFAQYLDPDFLAHAGAHVQGLNIPQQVQASLLMGATQKFLTDHGGRPSFRALIAEVREGLQGEAPRGATRLKEFDAAHPYALKNYLLNSLVITMFPRNDTAALESDFMALAVRFALIKFYLQALAARPEHPFGLDECVQVTYVVARNIEHNHRFMPMVLQSLKDNDALRMEVLATLVG
ncbi:flagellin lysine-N-methylase [Roseateles oligotrophus]|uniref:Flagellin lysine-N-methylase n=1 Tax=Roseateles oligotrophus TaxID=1769250 RepID=A0ABT2YAR4_9BURK|nr:flagellin lysine-N-methylase [Roseateles oligotrophus]MCV2367402.1 flagellin lysine-N-methylase [Roseateles oligotrophus]